MAWDIPLVVWGQLSWLCPFPAPCASSSSLQAGQHQEQRSPWSHTSVAQQQLKHWCVVAVFITNPKHGSVPGAREKINFAATGTRRGLHVQRQHPHFTLPPACPGCDRALREEQGSPEGSIRSPGNPRGSGFLLPICTTWAAPGKGPLVCPRRAGLGSRSDFCACFFFLTHLCCQSPAPV